MVQCTYKSLRMWFATPYYHKIFIFAVLEQWLIYDGETECSFGITSISHDWLKLETSNLARSYIKNMQNLVKRVMRSYMMHFRNFGIPLQSQVKWVTWPTFGILSQLYLENENAKLGQMGLWEGQVTHFCNFGTFLISDKQLKLETSNMARRLIARRYIENMLEECWKKL